MYAARIIGNVVCTQKDERMSGLKMHVVQPVNLITFEDEGKPAVAIDAVGAGDLEIVLVVGGSSARLTELTQNKPVDATIMAIVDYVDIEGKNVFSKHKKEI
ncbi:EutN/CcmL family microcompartment protein [Mycoplasmatota bacterium]|nr:EutN/CcmL family microcompartment protein [Mycoplasmatota bacterium]